METSSQDGCKGKRLYGGLVQLSWLGIDYNLIYAAAIGTRPGMTICRLGAIRRMPG